MPFSEPIHDRFTALDLVRKPALLRELIRTVRQQRNMQYILGNGEVRRAQFQPKAVDSIVNLSDLSATGISNLSSTCNINGSGGVETDVGPDRVHVFNASGVFNVGCAGTLDLLIIAGGGGGGTLGGGGAGGRVYLQNVSVAAPGSFTITVGAGGVGALAAGGAAQQGGDGGASSAFGNNAIGGGGGGGYGDAVQTGRAGGSGGGGGEAAAFTGGGGGTPVSGQGNSGGTGQNGLMGSQAGAGGGGAGSAGVNGGVGGTGGDGVADNITGTAIPRAAGGGAGGTGGAGAGGSGGVGGGGATAATPATAPIANTGSGGGGGYLALQDATDGAAGVVIIRYRRTGNSIANGLPPGEEFEEPTEETEQQNLEFNQILTSQGGDVLVSRTGNVLTSRATS